MIWVDRTSSRGRQQHPFVLFFLLWTVKGKKEMISRTTVTNMTIKMSGVQTNVVKRDKGH